MSAEAQTPGSQTPGSQSPGSQPPGADAAAAAARARWALILASVGVFLTSLDVVVLATALPTIRVQLHASLSDLEWTINAFNLVFA